MIFGREASKSCNEWIKTFTEQTNLTDYVSKIVQAIANAWRVLGDHRTKEVVYKIPLKRLSFVEYKVEDKFYRVEQCNQQQHIYTSLSWGFQFKNAKLALTPDEPKINRETERN